MWLMQREADLEMPVSLGQIIEIDCLNSTVKMLEYSLILLWAQ
jgi:CRISPR/Cas system-associated exonuclease Cas4 (RecB family)